MAHSLVGLMVIHLICLKTSMLLQAEKKASAHMKYLELLRQKPPDFTVPLRAHTVWQHMTVLLTCVVQGYPTPKVTW